MNQKPLLSISAVLVLMICCFSAGATVFAGKPQAQPETLELKEFDLPLILPDSRAGQYSVEQVE